MSYTRENERIYEALTLSSCIIRSFAHLHSAYIRDKPQDQPGAQFNGIRQQAVHHVLEDGEALQNRAAGALPVRADGWAAAGR